jgi:hypothetical protein
MSLLPAPVEHLVAWGQYMRKRGLKARLSAAIEVSTIA